MSDTMTEEELRAIDSEEFEGKDIPWKNGFYRDTKIPYAFTGRLLFDYDQGLSILQKENPEKCLTGIHGPAFKGASNYKDRKQYHLCLTEVFKMLREGVFNGPRFIAAIKYARRGNGHATCSFTG